jgi:60 kDa SS-A/Ro ribonucleoprotein
LDKAFYLAFGAVEPTGKRLCLALDISGSMSASVSGVPVLSCREAAAAMALVTMNVEDNYEILGYSSGGTRELSPNISNRRWFGGMDAISCLSISPRQRLDDVVQYTSHLPMGGTDCALPMRWALQNKVPVDAFITYTDSESWDGDIHVHQAIKQYRDKMGIPAKSIVVAMATNEYSVADPNDAGQMDVVGFDTAVPNIMSNFIRE